MWFVHIIVCDSVSANEKAAQLLLARYRKRGPANTTYFVMLVKCANHQANLVVGSAVDGHAATIGALQAATILDRSAPDQLLSRAASNDAKTSPHRTVCGAIVRLFKYLINQYYSDFYVSLVSHVATLQIVADASPAVLRAAAQRDDASGQLEALYGNGVFPKGLRELLNSGFDKWEHVVPEASLAAYRASPEDYAAKVRASLVELLRSHLLTVDEHPTYTRMFTFNGNLNKLLAFVFLRLTRRVLRFVAVDPRKDRATTALSGISSNSGQHGGGRSAWASRLLQRKRVSPETHERVRWPATSVQLHSCVDAMPVSAFV